MERNFRYHRQFRYPEACPPWVMGVMGAELGWIVSSPVDIRFSPLDDVQVAASTGQADSEIARVLGRDMFLRRADGYIAMTGTDWLRAYQYRRRDGSWEAMFVPNSLGTVEWRLGWAASIPDGYFLLVIPVDGLDGVSVPTGILTAQQVNRTSERGGFSLAVKPERDVGIRRGQPIARLVLLSKVSIQAAIDYRPLAVEP